MLFVQRIRRLSYEFPKKKCSPVKIIFKYSNNNTESNCNSAMAPIKKEQWSDSRHQVKLYLLQSQNLLHNVNEVLVTFFLSMKFAWTRSCTTYN